MDDDKNLQLHRVTCSCNSSSIILVFVKVLTHFFSLGLHSTANHMASAERAKNMIIVSVETKIGYFGNPLIFYFTSLCWKRDTSED